MYHKKGYYMQSIASKGTNVKEFDNKLAQFFNELNATPIYTLELVTTGEIQRFKVGNTDNKDGWYAATKFIDSNNETQIAFWGSSWKAGSSHFSIYSFGDMSKKDKKYREHAAAQVQEAKNAVKKEALRQQIECMTIANDHYSKAMPISQKTDHWYLKQKNILPYNARLFRKYQGSDLNLIVPVYTYDNGLIGYQSIFKDKQDKTEKRFLKGTKTSGSINCLLDVDALQKAKYCYITDGYATAATIQELFPKIPVVIAWNAYNLVNACKEVRKFNSKVKILIAADLDEESKTGEKYAKKACAQIKNTAYVMPTFPEEIINKVDAKNRSDFNDLFTLVPETDALKKQLAITDQSFHDLILLGMEHSRNKMKFVLSSTLIQRPIILSSDDMMKEHALYAVFPYNEYWFKKFSHLVQEKEDKEGNTYEVLNWKAVGKELMNKCSKIGMRDTRKERGLGVWPDGDAIVVCDGEEIHNKPEDSEMLYTTSAVDMNTFSYTADGDYDTLGDFLRNMGDHLPFASKFDSMIYAGFMVQSYIYGILPWRVHVSMTGRAGSGKSALTIDWPRKIGGASRLVLPSDTQKAVASEVGTGQALILFDEKETARCQSEKMKQQQWLECMRLSSKLDTAMTHSRTLFGDGLRSNNFLMLFAGIQGDSDMRTSADESRIIDIVVDTSYHKKSYVEWANKLDEVSKHRGAFQRHLIKNIDKITEAKAVFKAQLIDFTRSKRIADTLATIISCHYALYMDLLDPQEYFTMAVDEFEIWDCSFTAKASQDSMGIMALRDLFSKTIRHSGHDLTVGSMLALIHDDYEGGEALMYQDSILLPRLLAGIGIKLKDGKLTIQNLNNARNNILPDYPKLGLVLKHDENVQKAFIDHAENKTISMGGTKSKCKNYDYSKLIDILSHVG